MSEIACKVGFHDPAKWDCGCTQWGGLCCKNQQKVARCKRCGKLLGQDDLNFLTKREAMARAFSAYEYSLTAAESKLAAQAERIAALEREVKEAEDRGWNKAVHRLCAEGRALPPREILAFARPQPEPGKGGT